MKLPEDVIVIISAFANESGNAKRNFARALIECGFVAEIPHGRHEEVYGMIADTWNAHSGEDVTARTVRYWIQSVQDFTADELREFRDLSSAQLVEAVKLATIAKVPAADICRWAVENEAQTVAAMQAKFLPKEKPSDPPVVAGLIRWFGKVANKFTERKSRIDEMIAEVRSWL